MKLKRISELYDIAQRDKKFYFTHAIVIQKEVMDLHVSTAPLSHSASHSEPLHKKNHASPFFAPNSIHLISSPINAEALFSIAAGSLATPFSSKASLIFGTGK